MAVPVPAEVGSSLEELPVFANRLWRGRDCASSSSVSIMLSMK
jgi:hypothetical protein